MKLEKYEGKSVRYGEYNGVVVRRNLYLVQEAQKMGINLLKLPKSAVNERKLREIPQQDLEKEVIKSIRVKDRFVAVQIDKQGRRMRVPLNIENVH